MKENPLLTLAVLALSLATVFKTTVLAAEADASTVVEFEGMIVPAREAEITPLVSGWLKKIDFVPGQYVHEGDVLFEFDQTPQKVKIKLAEAQLKSAQASLQDAEVKLKRAMTLQSKDVVTESILQEAEAGRDIAAANVEQGKFSLEL